MSAPVMRRIAAHRGRAKSLLATAVLADHRRAGVRAARDVAGARTGAALWALVRFPFAIPLTLIVLMGNVKVNYYLGFFTLFPEYLVLMVACGLGFVVVVARDRRGRPSAGW